MPRPPVPRPAPRPARRVRTTSSAHASIERVFRIHVLINQGERVTAGRVAEEFAVEARTVGRDIRFMRQRLGVPIEYHSKWGSYHYARPCPALPFFRLTPRDLDLLGIAHRRFAAWAGDGIGAMLRGVYGKMASVSGGAAALAHADPAAGAPLTEFASREQEHLPAVWAAMERRQEIRVVYRKRSTAAPERRILQPLLVDCPGRRWLLIARDAGRAGLRTFRLGRIESVETTGKRFKVPEDFDPAKALAGNVGAFSGTGDFEVRIACRDTAATLAEEEGLHRSQQLSPLPDGRLLATLRLNNLVEIVHTILGLGPDAEVLSPPELRESVRTAVRKMHGIYET